MENALPRLPPRSPTSHKGHYGRALLIGGSRGMSGAIALAGVSALRGGAGLVQLAVPDECEIQIAAYEPSYMVVGLPSADGLFARAARPEIERLVADSSVVACGPGLGQSDLLTSIVGWLYAHCRWPTVFDADALNALAERREQLAPAAAPRILTPHPGEFGRLVGLPIPEALAKRETLADELAARAGAVVVVKGHRSYITDGQRKAMNETGNPGLATGGTGDVLTGLIAALLGQGLEPFAAARLGVHLHGLAGDLAAADLGQISLIASDLPKYLPAAFKSLASS